ncbi:MAG: trigger factor [Patescibacteria group bacterium]|jgi:trigger factor|nr:trigger factor [Patescibacteria group bacterium]
MNHKISYLPKSQIELEVVLSPEEMENFWKLAKDKVLKDVNLNGFRKGNIPEELIKNTDLEEKIFDEAANLAFRKSLADVVNELDLELIGQPEVNIKKIAPQNEFIYILKSAILPKPKLGDYKTISRDVFKQKKVLDVSDKEIDDAIDWLQKSRAKVVEVNRPAHKDDVVEIEAKCFINGEAIKDFPENDRFILGQGKYPAGFEEQLEGLSKNDEKKISIQTPADYWKENLRNKQLNFEVKIKSVNERQLPELNDEWAKSLGNFNGLDELKNSIKEGILMEKDLKERERLRILLLEKLIEKAEIELPDILVDGETENQFHSLRHFIEDQGMSFEEYLRKINKKEEELKKELRKESEKTLKGFIVLRTIAKLENCEPSPEEINQATNEILNQKAMEGVDVNQIDRAALMEYTKERLTNEKVFQFLENQVNN